MRDKLNQAIKQCEEHLKNDLSPTSRNRDEIYLEIFLSYKLLLNYFSDEILPQGMKFCYRYGKRVIENCDVCESCITAEDLAGMGEMRND